MALSLLITWFYANRKILLLFDGIKHPQFEVGFWFNMSLKGNIHPLYFSMKNSSSIRDKFSGTNVAYLKLSSDKINYQWCFLGPKSLDRQRKASIICEYLLMCKHFVCPRVSTFSEVCLYACCSWVVYKFKYLITAQAREKCIYRWCVIVCSSPMSLYWGQRKKV